MKKDELINLALTSYKQQLSNQVDPITALEDTLNRVILDLEENRIKNLADALKKIRSLDSNEAESDLHYLKEAVDIAQTIATNALNKHNEFL